MQSVNVNDEMLQIKPKLSPYRHAGTILISAKIIQGYGKVLNPSYDHLWMVKHLKPQLRSYRDVGTS